jgi:hypothetical protein
VRVVIAEAHSSRAEADLRRLFRPLGYEELIFSAPAYAHRHRSDVRVTPSRIDSLVFYRPSLLRLPARNDATRTHHRARGRGAGRGGGAGRGPGRGRAAIAAGSEVGT